MHEQEWIDVCHGLRKPDGNFTLLLATMRVRATGETLEQRVIFRDRETLRRKREVSQIHPLDVPAQNTSLAGSHGGSHSGRIPQDAGGEPVYLENIQNVQCSWVTQGLKTCQLGLRFGANDVGSIMIEENVVSATGTHHRSNEEELRHLIRDAGFVPKQRDTLYRTFFLN